MITIIVAVDHDGLIGKKDSSNGMPWHNKEDLYHFKKTTLQQTLVMGKTTYQAIGKPLPQRKTIVLTHSDWNDEQVEVRHSLKEVIDEYRQLNQNLYIAGGASVYEQALPLADCLMISRIPGKHEGETYFPKFDKYDYKLKKIQDFETFQLEIYERG